MERLALHEGTSFLKQGAAWVAARNVAVASALVSLAVNLCEVSILVVRAAGDLPV